MESTAVVVVVGGVVMVVVATAIEIVGQPSGIHIGTDQTAGTKTV